MNYYGVEFNNRCIKVEADSKKKAKYIAWLKYKKTYSVKFIDFVRNVSEVALLQWWE